MLIYVDLSNVQCLNVGVRQRTVFCQISLIILFCVVISFGLSLLFAVSFMDFLCF